MKRGDIYYADLNPVVGSEQGGLRPVLVIQNNVGNKCSPTTIVSAITSNRDKIEIPTHVYVKVDGLSRSSIVLLKQIGKEYYVERESLIQFLEDFKGQEILI